MASYLDKTPTFNPYIQQQPVEDMVKVGMQKQQQYNEGVEKIQNNINNIAGLDVIRNVDKQYLQSKLNNLGNKLKTVAAGDFSNFQLVNSVSGMTNEIAKDKNVLNAVSSTMKYKKEISRIEEQKNKGLVTPENLYNFQKNANNWLSSGDVSQSFNTSYIDYFDVEKYLRDNFDKLKEDEYSYDEVFTKDKNGNLQLTPSMQRREAKGLFPERVKIILNQLLSDPRVDQQLQISGEYIYKNYDENTLASQMMSLKSESLKNLELEKEKLLIKKATGSSDDINEKIDEITLQIQKSSEYYDNAIKSSYQNPDVIRGILHKGNSKASYLHMFSYKNEISKTLKNPEWKGRFDIQKENIRNNQWNLTYQLNKEKLSLEKQKVLLEKQNNNKDENDINPNLYFVDKQASDLDRMTYHNNVLNDALSKDEQLTTDIIFDALNSNGELNKYFSQLGKSGIQLSDAKKRELAIKQFKNLSQEEFNVWKISKVKEINEEYNQNKSSNNYVRNFKLEEQFSAYNKNYQNLKYIKRIDDELKHKFNEALVESGAFEKIKDLKPIKIDNNITLTQEDQLLISLAQLNKNWGFSSKKTKVKNDVAKTAISKLENKYGAQKVEYILNDLNGTSGGGRKRISSDSIFLLRKNVTGLLSDVKYENIFDKQFNIINDAYSINSNLAVSLASGNTEKDKNKLSQLKGFVTSMGNQNLSENYTAFKEKISSSDADLLKLGVTAKINGQNPDKVLLELPNNGGSMYIEKDMAKNLGINPDVLYKPFDVLKIEESLKADGATTFDINDENNYTHALAAMTTEEFVNLGSNKEFDVFVHFINTSLGPKPVIKITKTTYNSNTKKYEKSSMMDNTLSSKPNVALAKKSLIDIIDPSYLNLLFQQNNL